MLNEISVRVVKLPSAIREVNCYAGDSIQRVLTQAFPGEDFNRYVITVDGHAAALTDQITSNGSTITIATMTKGN